MMKKMVSTVLLVLMLLSLCACGAGANTLEGAINRADQMVSEWHSERYADCVYKAEYLDEYNGYDTSIYIVEVGYPTSVEDAESPRFVKSYLMADIRDNVYPQLEEVFQGYDVSVGLFLSDVNGNNVFASIFDGEVEYYE